MLWLILILLSAGMLAAWVLMLRRDVMHEHNTQVIGIYSIAIVIMSLVVSRLIDAPIRFDILWSSLGFLIFIKTLIIAISLYCTSLAVGKLPLSVVGPLRNFNPLFVALLGTLLLGELLAPVNVLGLVILVIGAVLLDLDIRHPKNIQEFKGHLKNPAAWLVLLAAFIVAFSPLLDRILLTKTNIWTILFWHNCMLLVMYWIIHGIKEKKLPFQGLRYHELLWLLLTGVTLFAADTFYFLALSFPAVMVAVIIGVRRLSNLFVTVFGGAVLHEQHGLYKAVICCIMVIGTILLVL